MNRPSHPQERAQSRSTRSTSWNRLAPWILSRTLSPGCRASCAGRAGSGRCWWVSRSGTPPTRSSCSCRSVRGERGLARLPAAHRALRRRAHRRRYRQRSAVSRDRAGRLRELGPAAAQGRGCSCHRKCPRRGPSDRVAATTAGRSVAPRAVDRPGRHRNAHTRRCARRTRTACRPAAACRQARSGQPLAGWSRRSIITLASPTAAPRAPASASSSGTGSTAHPSSRVHVQGLVDLVEPDRGRRAGRCPGNQFEAARAASRSAADRCR